MNRKSTASVPEVYYPDSDGKPMGETPLHVQNFRWLLEMLEVWFAEQKRVFLLCRRMLQDAEEADSATQDTFLKAWQASSRAEAPWKLANSCTGCAVESAFITEV